MEIVELRAFDEACEAAETTLSTIPGSAWPRPALGEWTLAELVAHMVGVVERLGGATRSSPDADQPACDRVGYYQRPGRRSGAARPREAAADTDPAELPALFADRWRVSSGLVGTLAAERLVTTPRGVMRVDEYLATRVLEVVVHHLDVRCALEAPPVVPPLAGRLTLRLLEGLLGGPKPRNFGRDRFILSATGRLASDDPRFPVLR